MGKMAMETTMAATATALTVTTIAATTTTTTTTTAILSRATTTAFTPAPLPFPPPLRSPAPPSLQKHPSKRHYPHHQQRQHPSPPSSAPIVIPTPARQQTTNPTTTTTTATLAPLRRLLLGRTALRREARLVRRGVRLSERIAATRAVVIFADYLSDLAALDVLGNAASHPDWQAALIALFAGVVAGGAAADFVTGLAAWLSACYLPRGAFAALPPPPPSPSIPPRLSSPRPSSSSSMSLSLPTPMPTPLAHRTRKARPRAHVPLPPPSAEATIEAATETETPANYYVSGTASASITTTGTPPSQAVAATTAAVTATTPAISTQQIPAHASCPPNSTTNTHTRTLLSVDTSPVTAAPSSQSRATTATAGDSVPDIAAAQTSQGLSPTQPAPATTVTKRPRTRPPPRRDDVFDTLVNSCFVCTPPLTVLTGVSNASSGDVVDIFIETTAVAMLTLCALAPLLRPDPAGSYRRADPLPIAILRRVRLLKPRGAPGWAQLAGITDPLLNLLLPLLEGALGRVGVLPRVNEPPTQPPEH